MIFTFVCPSRYMSMAVHFEGNPYSLSRQKHMLSGFFIHERAHNCCLHNWVIICNEFSRTQQNITKEDVKIRWIHVCINIDCGMQFNISIILISNYQKKVWCKEYLWNPFIKICLYTFHDLVTLFRMPWFDHPFIWRTLIMIKMSQQYS